MSGWRDEAACRDVDDPDTFFPYRPSSRRADIERVRQAREICDRCPVWEECLATVLALPSAYDADGIYAGLLPRDRADLRGDLDADHRGHSVTLLTGGPVGPDGRPERARRPHERRSAMGHSQDTLTVESDPAGQGPEIRTPACAEPV